MSKLAVFGKCFFEFERKIKNLLKAPCILQGEIFVEFGITDWLRGLDGFNAEGGSWNDFSHNGGPASHITMSSKSSHRRLSKTGLTHIGATSE
jgi:hypothetical protein